MLADQNPRCQLSRRAVDLADPAARDGFLNEALAGARKAFVLTEGLLMYLTDSDVAGLAEAFLRPEIAWWTINFASDGLLKTMNGKTTGMLQNAPARQQTLERGRLPDAAADQSSIGSIAARGTSTWVAPAASGSSVPWLKKKITPSLVIAKFW